MTEQRHPGFNGMKKVFAKISNVNNFLSAITKLNNREEGIPGMALIYGEPGLGKTRTALWWAAQHDGVFVRTKKLMSGRWLLEELVAELGESPTWKTSELFRQCIEQLLAKPRVVIVDEVDYLTYDARVIETLRDIHDTTGTPIVFIGMGNADKKLMRYRHLYDRFSEVLKFHDLTEADVKTITEQMCDVRLSEDAVKYIHDRAHRFRRVVVWLYKAESFAKGNNLKEITAKHLDSLRSVGR
jgi:DNA transposition AAA+ family ATPase